VRSRGYQPDWIVDLIKRVGGEQSWPPDEDGAVSGQPAPRWRNGVARLLARLAPRRRRPERRGNRPRRWPLGAGP